MHLTSDAVVAFADDNVDDAVAESQLAAGPDDWDECLVGIVGRRDATTGEIEDAASCPWLLVSIQTVVCWGRNEGFMGCEFAHRILFVSFMVRIVINSLKCFIIQFFQQSSVK